MFEGIRHWSNLWNKTTRMNDFTVEIASLIPLIYLGTGYADLSVYAVKPANFDNLISGIY